MKRSKKLIAILLAVCTLVSMSVPAFADVTDPIVPPEQDPDAFNYVALGASMSNGYGMRYYLDEDYYLDALPPTGLSKDGPGASGWRNNVETSYPWLIYYNLVNRLAGKSDVKLHQLAQSSMRVEELRVLIDNDYYGDEYTGWRFYNPGDPNPWWNDYLEQFRQDYQDSITNADLITYDLGVNNFGVYLSNRLMDHTRTKFDSNFANIFGVDCAAKFYALRDEIHASVNGLLGDAIPFEDIDFYLDTLAYALLGFEVNFDATMKRIRELNPDCDIVVVSIQNPMADLNLSISDFIIPFGDVFQVIIDMANLYMQLQSPYRREYSYADLGKGHVTFFYDEMMQYDGDPSSLSKYLLDCFNIYDRKLHIKWSLEHEGIPGQDDYIHVPTASVSEWGEDVLSAVYDAMAKMLKAAGAVNPMPLDGIINDGEDMGAAGDDLMDDFRAEINKVANYAYEKWVAEHKVEAVTIQKEDEQILASAESAVAVEEIVSEEAPAEKAVNEEAPAEEIVNEEAVVEEVVNEEAVVEEVVNEEAVVEEVVNEEAPVEEVVNEETPAEEAVELETVMVAQEAEEPEEFDLDADIAYILRTDARKSAAAFGMRTSIGNTFFTHPSAAGHEQIASAIMVAWDNQISSRQALAEELKFAELDLINLLTKYSANISTFVLEKLADVFPMSDGMKSLLTKLIPTVKEPGKLAKAILDTYDITTFTAATNFRLRLKELGEILQKNPFLYHTHTLRYYPETKPGCTTRGVKAHYTCLTCGKYFLDMKTQYEVKYEELYIPAKKHTLKHVPAKASTLLSTGNIEYWICSDCGKLFADPQGTQQITNPLSVITPKQSLLKAIFGK